MSCILSITHTQKNLPGLKDLLCLQNFYAGIVMFCCRSNITAEVKYHIKYLRGYSCRSNSEFDLQCGSVSHRKSDFGLCNSRILNPLLALFSLDTADFPVPGFIRFKRCIQMYYAFRLAGKQYRTCSDIVRKLDKPYS